MSSEKKGCKEPRVYTKPLRKLTPKNTLGYECIDFAENMLGLVLLPWQKWLFIHALELDKSRKNLRFRTVLILIARQNGKTLEGAVLALFFLYICGSKLVLGTAQSLDISEDTWEESVEMAQANPDLNSMIDKIALRNGGKALVLKGGEKYKIAAATRKGGRGKSADLVLMDELREHTTFDSWSAITKTTLAKSNALVWCMTNAGDEQSIVLRHLRAKAHKRCGDPDGIAQEAEMFGAEADIDDDTLAIFEWSAPPEAPINDVDAIAQANPSLGYAFLPLRNIKASMATDPEPVFRTECLCQWVKSVLPRPFPAEAWEEGLDEYSQIADESPLFFGIDMEANRSHTSIAVCGKRADGLWHIEIIAYRTGFKWVEEFLTRLHKKNGTIKLGMQTRGAPIASYLNDLENIKGIEIVKCEGRDLGAWTGRFYDSVLANWENETDVVPLIHRPSPVLDTAAQTAQKKTIGDGAFCFDRNTSPDDISPLVAVTMAFGAATGGTTEKKYESVYSQENRLPVFA